jgi:DNA-binding NarL/FixJ family response regulator/tetratricopeptide (TPR) repeat protein
LASQDESRPLVGRARELRVLDDALARVARGTPFALELVGEAGIGKSRLLEELRGRALERGFDVLDGRAAEFERDVPFGAIIDALNDRVAALEPAQIRALDADVVAELAAVLPALAAERTPERDRPERYRVHYAVRALLERVAARRPVVLAVDDVHWADAASLEVIAHVLRRFRGPLLLALAFRRAPAELAASLEAAARGDGGARVVLGPLSLADARVLHPGASEALHRETGGNPFYLEQLAGSGSDAGAAGTASEAAAGAVPERVLATIAAELERLTPDARRTVQAAAVAGESFGTVLVAAIAELDEGVALTALDELLAAGLVQPTGGPRAFRFHHPILRSAVYSTMPGGWRVGAHARAAATLAATGAAPAELAHHVARSAEAGDEAAIELLTTAARATAPHAPLTAGRWLRAAADLVPGDARERRARLLGDAGAALTSGGAFDEALSALGEARALSPASGVIVKLAEARRRGGRPFVLREALEAAAATDPGAVAELAMDRHWHADHGRVRVLADALIAGARASDDAPLLALAASLASMAAGSEQRLGDARAHLAEAQATFDALSDDRLAERIYVTHYVGDAAVRLERADDALGHVRRGLDAAHATGQSATTRSWLGVAAYALLLKGEIAEAARVAGSELDPAALSRNDWRMVWTLGADAHAAALAGGDRALAAAGDMLERANRDYTATVLPELARVRLAAALLAAGDPGGACNELAERDPWLLDLDAAHGHDVLVRALLAVGEPHAAADAAAVALARADATVLPQRTATARLAEAATRLAAGDTGAAGESAREALALAEHAGNPYLAGRCRAALGAAAVAGGDVAQAVAELERAEQALSETGAIRDADAAARELRRLGHRVPRAARPDGPAGLPALSPREREVAREVATGKSNRDVAATLFVSEKTVESHLVRIYAKLDIHSRSALAALVVREGSRTPT